MKFIAKFILATMLFCTGANAFWEVTNSGKDVFGNVNVTASSFGDNGNLIRFECGSSSEPFVVFLLRDGSGEIPEIPATFIHAGPNNEKFEAEAILTSWNDKFVAVKVTDKKMLRGLAEHMISATKSISLGVAVPYSDFKKADTFSSRGSTAAGKIVLENCLTTGSSVEKTENQGTEIESELSNDFYSILEKAWKRERPSSKSEVRRGFETVIRARVVLSAASLFCDRNFEPETEFYFSTAWVRWQSWAGETYQTGRIPILKGLNEIFPENDAACEKIVEEAIKYHDAVFDYKQNND